MVSADTALFSPYVTFAPDLCTGCSECIKACPTKAIRLYNNNPTCLANKCIRCGECLRVCSSGAISITTYELEALQKDKVSIALVSPVLYSQFKGVMPNDILLALKKIGFHNVMDPSYYIEMYLYAVEEYIARNRTAGLSPWPLISPVCPVVIRLIAYQFPNLLPHLLPIMRPVSLIAKETRERISWEYKIKKDDIILYHLTPCPAKLVPTRSSFSRETYLVDRIMGIKDTDAVASLILLLVLVLEPLSIGLTVATTATWTARESTQNRNPQSASLDKEFIELTEKHSLTIGQIVQITGRKKPKTCEEWLNGKAPVPPKALKAIKAWANTQGKESVAEGKTNRRLGNKRTPSDISAQQE